MLLIPEFLKMQFSSMLYFGHQDCFAVLAALKNVYMHICTPVQLFCDDKLIFIKLLGY